MVAWLIIVLSILMPLVMVPMLLPTLVIMAKKKHITDAPNFRKRQQRPVSLMGGMLMVSVMATSLAIASLYVQLDDLFPAMCMVVLLMTIGLIDDSIDLSYIAKLVIQIGVASLLFFAGGYRITSLWTVFGITDIPLWFSICLSIFIGVLIMNAINFMDGIDGLIAEYGLFVSIVMASWGWNHAEFSHAILSLIMASSLFAFWVFNGFASRYKIYMGDSGSLVIGLYIYLSVCKLLSGRPYQDHLSNGYEASFVMALLAVPVFDLVRVVIHRIRLKKSPFEPDRSHLHHALVDLGYSHLSASTFIVLINLFIFILWGTLVELRVSHTLHLGIIFLSSLVLVWGPFLHLDYLANHKPERYRKRQIKVRRRRRYTTRIHLFVAQIIDNIPPLIR